MRISESRLRSLIRMMLKENKHLISEALKKGFQVVSEPTILNAIVTNVREFCSPSMLHDYDELGVGVLCDQIECHDFIATLYAAESQGIDVPNFNAKIVPSQFKGSKAIKVSVLGPISEDFVELFDEIQEEAQADTDFDPYEGTVKLPTANDGFKFSAEDSVKIINSTTVMN